MKNFHNEYAIYGSVSLAFTFLLDSQAGLRFRKTRGTNHCTRVYALSAANISIVLSKQLQAEFHQNDHWR